MGFAKSLCLLALSLCLLETGSGNCLAGAPPAIRENEISELKFERNRALAGLKESLAREREVSANLRKAQEEKDQVLAEAAQKDAAARSLKDQVQKLTGDRSELEKSLAEMREAERKRRQSSEKLMELATNSSEELTGLRQRLETASTERARLGVENQGLQKQLTTTTHELEELKAELTRNRAVVRAFQEHPSPGAESPVEAALRARIDELEHNLEKATASPAEGRQGGETAAAGVQGAPSAAAGGTAADPASLWKGFLALLLDRARAAFRGDFQGDAFDWTVIGVGGSALILPGLLVLSWKRSGRLRRELKRQRAEKRQPAAQRATPPEEDFPLPASPRDVQRPVSNRNIVIQRQASSRNIAIPRPPSSRNVAIQRPASSRNVAIQPGLEDRDFSAIISSPKRTGKTSDTPEPGSQPIHAGTAPAPRAHQPPEPARPAEARRLSFRTQKPPETPVEPQRAPEPKRAAPAGQRATAQPQQTPPSPAPVEAAERRNFAQRLSPPKAAGEDGKSPAGAKGGKEDKALMDDLRAEISKKIDELIP